MTDDDPADPPRDDAERAARGEAPPSAQGEAPPSAQGEAPPSAQGEAPPSAQGEAPPSAWIRTIEPLEATGDVAQAYADFFDPQTGAMDNIMKVHGLLPRSLKAHYDLYRSAMDSTPSLHRAEREMIAVAVSGINGCHY